jgi:HK97 family phage prohead protease
MKNKIFHIASTFKAKETDEGTLKISGMASTSDKDRVGDVVLPSAWSKGLENYKKNPIILFNHDYSRPIGRATNVSVSDKGLAVDANISKANAEMQQLIKDGVLSTFSVSFAVKDADYMEATDGYLIKDAELYEVSVVSIPCNQEATFSLAKSFDSEDEYREYMKKFTTVPAEESAEDSAIVKASAGNMAEGEESPIKEIDMTPEELQKMLKEAASEAAKETAAALAKDQADKAAAAEKAKQDAEAFDVRVKTSAEKIIEGIEARFAEKNANMESVVAELKDELKAKATEIEAIQKSKRSFSDRGDGIDDKAMAKEADDAYVVGLATGKGWNTDIGKRFMEKTAGNAASGVVVPNLESWETLVSTSIERDIQHELVLAPLFREIAMNSAVMKFPVLPDAGYAEFTAANTNASGSAYKGNLDQRGATYGSAYGGVTLEERTLTVKMIKSVSWLGNEVEEDAILPILPLIRESIVRSHARTVEHSLLLGGHSTATVTGAFDGLVEIARDNSKALVMGTDTAYVTGESNYATVHLNALELLYLRKAMGKYGMRPSDLVYIVNERGYFELMEDSEWQDVSQVAQDSMKLKGAVGRIYGTEVIVCPEFATPATSAVNAVAVNVRNFLVPRLRGLTLESEYEAVNQRRAMIATQRLGFAEIISGASAVATLAYPAS